MAIHVGRCARACGEIRECAHTCGARPCPALAGASEKKTKQQKRTTPASGGGEEDDEKGEPRPLGRARRTTPARAGAGEIEDEEIWPQPARWAGERRSNKKRQASIKKTRIKHHERSQ